MGREGSKGDPRVYWFLNVTLSLLFAWIVLTALSLITEFEWNLVTLALFTFILVVVTHLVVGRM